VQCTATYRALDAKGIEYTVVDLTTNPAALEYVMDELGYSAAPVVVASDQDHWSGFRPDLIDKHAA
jgi:glutaredoxin-like protein NrdH